MNKIFIFAIAAIVALIAFTPQESEASHWRFGHLTWKPNPVVSPNAADFTFIAAFRRNGYSGTAGDNYPAIGDIISEIIGGTGMFFGDGGPSTGVLQFKVIAIDPAENWLLGQALEPGSNTKTTITRVYPSPDNGGNPWVAGVSSCCRTGGEVNNPNRSYSLLTYVELSSGNSSPVSSLPAIVNLPQGANSSFLVPATDSDPNTLLQWRLATATEAAGGGLFTQPFANPFALVVDQNTGLATWNTTNAVLGALYSCQIIIEDRDATTGALRTQVGIDFLIRITQCDPNNNTPTFAAPTPTCGSLFSAYVGQTINFTVQAEDVDANDNVTLNTGGLPTGAFMNPSLPTAGNPVSSVFSWTPGIGDIGNYIVTYSATDNCGAQSLCSFTIEVTDAPPPPTSCPYSQGYWKNHGDFWPQSALDMYLGTTNSYTKAKLLSILRSAPRGDASIILAHQLIAAKLNVANGSPVPANVQTALDDADYAIGSSSIPMNVRPNTSKGGTMTTLAGILDDYNNGYFTQNCTRNDKRSSGEANYDGYELLGNFPNPMTGSTEIQFVMPEAGFVNLQIFNSTGQLVKTLLGNDMSSGMHFVNWDGTDDNGFELTSGVYTYRLQAGSFIQSSRMIIIR